LIPEATEFSYLVFNGRGDLSLLSTCPKRESSFQLTPKKNKKFWAVWQHSWCKWTCGPHWIWYEIDKIETVRMNLKI